MEGLLVLLHVHLGQLAALQAQSDPILLLLVQGQDRLAHEGAGEDAALIEGLLQTGVGLAGGLAGGFLGGKLYGKISTKFLKWLFAAFLFYAGVKYLL